MVENKFQVYPENYLNGRDGNVTLVGSEESDFLTGTNSQSQTNGPINMYGKGGSDVFDLKIFSDAGSDIQNTAGESFVSVGDFTRDNNEYDEIRVAIHDMDENSSRLYNYIGSDGKHHSNVFLDLDGSGVSDNLVATVEGNAFVSQGDIYFK